MSSKVVTIVVAVVAVIVIALGVAWFVMRSPRAPETPAAEQAVEQPAAEPTPTLQERLSERLKGVTLAGSDDAVREFVGALSSRPEVATWLANEDLVRRFVASVDLIADGKSPRSQLEFLKPSGAFKVDRRGDGFVIDASSYRRYDVLAEAVSGLDTDGVAKVFTELEPLIDEAHREIAPPGSEFRASLKSAIDQLLAVPVLTGEVAVTPKVVTYRYDDPAIEGLSEAQRQFLRMGPDNVAKVQTKLREIETALGL